MLSETMKAEWEAKGFLFLPGLVPSEVVEAAARVADERWARHDGTVGALRDRARAIVEPALRRYDAARGRAIRALTAGADPNTSSMRALARWEHARADLLDAIAGTRVESHRLLMLYRRHAAVRAVGLHDAVTRVVSDLLGQTPVLFFSSSLRWSRSSDHVDEFPGEGFDGDVVVGSWTACEDIHPDAGSLLLYPGTHHGAAERPAPHVIQARVGDVVLWHGRLLHGSHPARDRRLTRKSLICHYAPLPSFGRQGDEVQPHGQGYWRVSGLRPPSISSRARR